MDFVTILASIGYSLLRFFAVLDLILNWVAKKAFLCIPILLLGFYVIWHWIIKLVSSYALEYFSHVSLSVSVAQRLLEIYAFLNYAFPLYEMLQVFYYLLHVLLVCGTLRAIKRFIPGLSE